LGSQARKTKVCNNGGKNPRYTSKHENEMRFEFPNNDPGELSIKIEAWDYMGKSKVPKIIGGGWINLTAQLAEGKAGAQEISVKLTDAETNDAGMVILDLGFIDLFQVMIVSGKKIKKITGSILFSQKSYVKITPPWSDQCSKTDVSSGKNPKWSKHQKNMMRFPFTLTTQKAGQYSSLLKIPITLEVFAQNKKGEDALVGTGTIDCKDLWDLASGRIQSSFDRKKKMIHLKHANHNAGTLFQKVIEIYDAGADSVGQVEVMCGFLVDYDSRIIDYLHLEAEHKDGTAFNTYNWKDGDDDQERQREEEERKYYSESVYDGLEDNEGKDNYDCEDNDDRVENIDGEQYTYENEEKIDSNNATEEQKSENNEASLQYQWIKLWDPRSERYYFYNNVTLESQWEVPKGFVDPDINSESWSDHYERANAQVKSALALQAMLRFRFARNRIRWKKASLHYEENYGERSDAPLWIEMFDQSSGHPYYYNNETGQTTWENPNIDN